MYGRGQQTVSFGPPHTPDIIKTLILVNAGIFIVQLLVGTRMIELFAVWPAMVWEGGYLWQPFTYMWLHSPGSFLHILFNMFALWMFGSPVASAWGEKRFLRYYLLCGLGAGIVIAGLPALLMLAGIGSGESYFRPTLGASGAVFGVLLAYALTWPDRTIMLLFPPIPIKAIWFIPIILGIELLSQRGNVSTTGHLGGVVVGYVLLRRMGVGPQLGLRQLQYRWRRWRMRRNLRAVRMEDEKRRQSDRGFFH